jgi:homoserine kinase
MKLSKVKVMEKVLKTLTLQIPGSASNLGPGLDTVALALAIYCRLSFTLLGDDDPEQPFVSWEGFVARQSLPSDMNNLIYKVLSKLWEDDPNLLRKIRVKVNSDIPLGCGLGASSAIILGALWAAAYFKDRVPTTAQLLSEASKLEGHPEGLAASLMGNFVVCAKSAARNLLIAKQHDWPVAWKPIVVVPSERLQTVTMRSLLPTLVKLDDAITNVQRTALLVSSVCRTDEQGLQESLHDQLHEIHRQSYISLLPKLRRILINEPILGCVASGAGPSVLILVHERNKERVLSQIKNWESTEEDKITILDLEVDTDGIKTIME